MRVRGETEVVVPGEWVARFMEQFTRVLRERATSWELLDLPAPPVQEIIDRAMALLPPAGPDVLAEAVGPVYDTAAVATLLGGVSTRALASRRRAGSILAIKTGDGLLVYPVFQFTGGVVNPALVAVFRALRDAPAWSVALWMVTPTEDLGGATPLGWVRGGRPNEEVVASARRTAGEWQ